MCIRDSNIQGMEDLVKYIYSQGHRKIAYIHGQEGSSVTRDRLCLLYTSGRERNIDFQSSGERNGKRPNRCACTAGFGPVSYTHLLSSALSAKASTLRSFLLDYSILVIIALITFVTNFWSVTYYSLKNFTVITMSWSNRYLIILSFCMKFSKYNVLTEVFISH